MITIGPSPSGNTGNIGSLPRALRDDESEMGCHWGLDRPRSFQFDLPQGEVLEEANSRTEEDWDEVDLHLVHQARLQVLPHDVCASPDSDVLLTCGPLARSRPASITSVTNV